MKFTDRIVSLFPKLSVHLPERKIYAIILPIMFVLYGEERYDAEIYSKT